MKKNLSPSGILWMVCAAVVAAMMLNAPSTNGQGGWRDQFAAAYSEGYANQRGGSPAPPQNADVAAPQP